MNDDLHRLLLRQVASIARFGKFDAPDSFFAPRRLRTGVAGESEVERATLPKESEDWRVVRACLPCYFEPSFSLTSKLCRVHATPGTFSPSSRPTQAQRILAT